MSKLFKLIPHPGTGSPIADRLYSNYFEYYNFCAEEMLCLLFPGCNFNCAWCRRDIQIRNQEGYRPDYTLYTIKEILTAFEDEAKPNSRLYFTGGDPSLFTDACLNLSKIMSAQFNMKIAYAHNGSSPKFVEKLLPYTHSAAIDLKGANDKEFSFRAGVTEKRASLYIGYGMEVQRILHSANALIDVRMPIFRETSLDDMKVATEMVISTGTEKKTLTFRAYRPISGLNWHPPDYNIMLRNVKTISTAYPELPFGMMKNFGTVRELTLFKEGKEVALSSYELKESQICKT